jgi:hypothetical protein
LGKLLHNIGKRGRTNNLGVSENSSYLLPMDIHLTTPGELFPAVSLLKLLSLREKRMTVEALEIHPNDIEHTT